LQKPPPIINLKILLSEKRPVKLGEGRINEGEIIPAAINRGIQAIHSYNRIT
jgi:exopolyphosphatase/pppGpp-phosphohydrolase